MKQARSRPVTIAKLDRYNKKIVELKKIIASNKSSDNTQVSMLMTALEEQCTLFENDLKARRVEKVK